MIIKNPINEIFTPNSLESIKDITKRYMDTLEQHGYMPKPNLIKHKRITLPQSLLHLKTKEEREEREAKEKIEREAKEAEEARIAKEKSEAEAKKQAEIEAAAARDAQLADEKYQAFLKENNYNPETDIMMPGEDGLNLLRRIAVFK